MNLMDDIIDALKILERTSRGLQNTLGQDLSPLLPSEQEKILANSLENHRRALEIAARTLKDLREMQAAHEMTVKKIQEGQVNGKA